MDILFYILNISILTFNFIDLVFFRYQFKRMTWDIFNFVGQNKGTFTRLIFDFIWDFKGVFLLWLLFSAALLFLSSRLKADPERYRKFSPKKYLSQTFIFIFTLALTLIGARGGIQDKPINITSAGKYTSQAYAPIILNTPYTIIKTKDEQHINPKVYFPEEEARKIFDPVKYYYKPGLKDSIDHPNIVILLLESFSAEHSAYLSPELYRGQKKGFMPFLDSLMQKSLVFKGIANGKYSLDAMPAVLISLPGLIGTPFITSPYLYDKLNTIPLMLKDRGYTSAYFHGATNGSLGLDGFARIAGFDKYYGRSEFGNDEYFDGKWGIFDEEFLQFTASTMKTLKEPFISTIFTLSSHHPCIIPEKYKGRFTKTGTDMQDAIMYTDYSLRKFFETASKSAWYNNTLFVIAADHTSISDQPFYNNMAGQYMIPIIFYKPHHEWKARKNELVQQADILPSIMDYLNYDKKFISFGNSVFDTTANRFGIVRVGNTYRLFQGPYLMSFENDKASSLYNIRQDSLLKINLIADDPWLTNEMENLLKSIIQQYDSRIVGNEMTTEPIHHIN